MSTPSNWLPPAPPENVEAYLLDLGQTATSTGFDIGPKIPDSFALVIDNALTRRECRELLAWGEARAQWEPALLNVGGGRQRLHTEVRNSERLIVDDVEVAAKLLERVRPFLEREGVDVVRTRGPLASGKKVWGSIMDPRFTSSPFRMTRMNERLRFLRYGPGQYFKRMHPLHVLHSPAPADFRQRTAMERTSPPTAGNNRSSHSTCTSARTVPKTSVAPRGSFTISRDRTWTSSRCKGKPDRTTIYIQALREVAN